MGERYERLLLHVVAFRAEVSEIRAKFKLGQNEQPDVLADAVKGLGPEGNLPLLTAMRHANRRR
jgi:transcriptional regulator